MKELLHWATLFLWVGGWAIIWGMNQDERDSRMGHDRNSRLLGG